MLKKGRLPNLPGVTKPIKASRGSVKVIAWRDTDVKGAKPSYFLEIIIKGHEPHEVLGVSPSRIRALADALAGIHDQLPKPRPSIPAEPSSGLANFLLGKTRTPTGGR